MTTKQKLLGLNDKSRMCGYVQVRFYEGERGKFLLSTRLSIYTKSKNTARKAGHEVFLFLKNKLKLPINRAKSGIRKPVQFEILGHRFVPAYQKGAKGKYQLVVSDKSWKNLKQNLRTITRKTTPLSVAQRITQLKEVGRGWVNYFRMASIHGKLKDLDSWVRNRLRYCIWHHWKKRERRRKKSDTIRSGLSSCLCMEQNKNGRMGCCTKPDTGDNNYAGKIEKARLPIHARLLLSSISTI